MAAEVFGGRLGTGLDWTITGGFHVGGGFYEVSYLLIRLQIQV